MTMQLPKSTGFGFGASIVVSGLYLLPSTVAMVLVGFAAGRIARRYGSKAAAVAGSAFAAGSFALIAAAHDHPYDMLLSAALLGIGIGLAFATLGNLVCTLAGLLIPSGRPIGTRPPWPAPESVPEQAGG